MSRELLFRKSPNRSNLIIVSNRLPVSIKKENGELIFNSSSGGLAVAMSSIEDEYTKKLWVGWPGINSDELTASEKKEISSKLWEMGCYPVFLTEKQVKKFYSGYANDTIWPLFHYFQSYTQHNSDYWSAYKEVNELYTKEVLKNIDNNTNIWVHDYHLMLLPKLLRDKKPDASIGFFLH
ncbi:trehalose-6-phosphate synthase, partial [Candidatus Saccharibacteria bacterium]|nr:trehalose-6-phosphate synthase [Candidatus Saccharibacteria bacterium]